MRHDNMQNQPDEKPTDKKPAPSRTDQARQVVEEYTSDLRVIISKLRKHLS